MAAKKKASKPKARPVSGIDAAIQALADAGFKINVHTSPKGEQCGASSTQWTDQVLPPDRQWVSSASPAVLATPDSPVARELKSLRESLGAVSHFATMIEGKLRPVLASWPENKKDSVPTTCAESPLVDELRDLCRMSDQTHKAFADILERITL